MSLIKKARQVIVEKFEDRPKMSKQELIEEIRPHYLVDMEKLIEQDLGRLANRIAASVKDKNGRREIFAVKDKDGRALVYLEKCNDIHDVNKVYDSIKKSHSGFSNTMKKVNKHRKKVLGQMSLFKEV
ncbi:hypothetical protein LJC10_00705 [Selenomonadales bacterium OttesenSCG-928-I06]|nr:hypothetical protein [Selenomonadales bacterium OttesenSCG-928-I06]